jgi:hypothetical protein
MSSSFSRNFLAILLFLSGTASVVSLLAPSQWLDPTVASVLRQGGPILFVAILAWTLKTGVARLENIEASQQKLTKDVEEFSKAEKHGHAIQDLQHLSGVMEKAGTIQAASKVFLRIASTEIPTMADSIGAYKDGVDLNVSESNVVSNVLAQLVDNLPERCVWLGTSRLVRGWDEAADPSFREFVNHLDRLAREKKIRVFRVYCVREGDRSHVENIVSGMRDSGGMARVLISDQMDIPDVSIIMQLNKGERMDACNDAQYAWSHSTAIYGMEFDVVAGVLVQRVRFVAPASTRFPNLLNTFKVNWNRAEEQECYGIRRDGVASRLT